MLGMDVIVKLDVSTYISDTAIYIQVPPWMLAHENLGEVVKQSIERQQRDGLDDLEIKDIKPMFTFRRKK